MNDSERSNGVETLPLDSLRAVLRDHPVDVAILFGSHTTGGVHDRSDVDIAVDLTVNPGEPGYNEAFFGLSAALSEALETDAVDVIDVHSMGPALARQVFDTGVLLLGDPERVAELRAELTENETSTSPRERFDDALRKIDDHMA